MKSATVQRWPSLGAQLTVGFSCLLFVGCFSGEYNARMEETMQRMQTQSERAGAVFDAASPVQDAQRSETGIKIQLPTFVNESAKALIAGNPNAQPPFYELPGYAYSYEIPQENGLAYVYFAAVPADQKPADQFAQEVQDAMAKKFSGSAWQDVTMQTLDGDGVAMKKLTAVGPQLFNGEKAEGQFDLYMVSSSSYHVLIGWRAPAGSPIFDQVAISMGTVTGSS